MRVSDRKSKIKYGRWKIIIGESNRQAAKALAVQRSPNLQSKSSWGKSAGLRKRKASQRAWGKEAKKAVTAAKSKRDKSVSSQ